MIDNELPPEPETDSPDLRPIVAAAARGDVAAFAHVISTYHADMKCISLISATSVGAQPRRLYWCPNCQAARAATS